jgi:cysteine-rich repeat protein
MPRFHLYSLGLITLASLPLVDCHSGTIRDLPSTSPPDGLDAGADGSVLGAGASGLAGSGSDPDEPLEGGTSGAGGTGGTGGTAGTSGAGGSVMTVDPPDASSDADAETDPDADAAPYCGDGNTDAALSEECDDGNSQHSDGCENDCKKTRIAHIGVGWTYNCALSSGGGVKCWGQDIYGALGRGTTGADISDPLQVPPLDFGTSRRVVQLSTGYYHACVRFEDNKARCWGRNENGQLGRNTQLDWGDSPDEPLSALDDLSLSNVQTITAGRYNTCVIAGTTGLERLYCWGSNIRGEVGLSNTSTTPVLDQPSSPVELSAQALETIAGTRWVCALLPTAARCWGSFDYGVRGVGATSIWLGDNELPNSSTYDVKGLPAAPTMLSGRSSTLCALVGGDAYCWGRNLAGEAGYPGDLANTACGRSRGGVAGASQTVGELHLRPR